MQEPLQTPVNQSVTLDPMGPGPVSPLNQFLQQMDVVSKKNNPTYGTRANEMITVPTSQTRRYDDQEFGYMYGADNEDFYGQRQSGLEKIGNGLLKLAGYTVAKTGSGIGYLGGLINPTNWMSEEGYLVSAADNAFSKVFENLEDDIRDKWAPTFQEAEDRDKGFWSRAFTDIDFWTEDAVDGLAFLASAYVPGGILAKLGTGAKIAKSLSGLRMGAQGAAEIVGGVETASNYLRQASNIASKIDKGLMWGAATASEAMVEAKGVKDYLTENLADSGFTDEEKKEIIGGAMRNTFLMNAALLGVSNQLELGMFYKAFGKSDTVAKNIIQEGKLGSAFVADIAKPVGRLDKILQHPVTKFISAGAKGVAREGFGEENMQLAIQRMNQEYGLAGRVATMNDLDELGVRFYGQTKKALSGEDTEASMSIGLGGILGGLPSAIGDTRQEKRDKITTENAIKQLNLAQQNWTKFGNIYQTETVDVTDANGNVVKQERLKLDENKRPIEDIEKVNAIAAGMAVNANLMSAADKEQNVFNRKLMRDMAFGNFVNAHISAGMEDTLLNKLEEAMTATPEDLLKMGFDPTYDHKQQIFEYKELASNIIKKNKLVQNDVIIDNSEEDQVRRRMLTDYVTQQAIFEKLSAETLKESKELAAEFLKPIAGVTTDSLVTQLNLLQQRIDLAKETLSETKEGEKTPLTDQFTQRLIAELSTEKIELEKANELSVKDLTKKSGGYYSYQNRPGNNPMLEVYRNKLETHGALMNEARLAGLKFAKFADTKVGQNNFQEFRNFIQETIVDPANKALEEANKQRSAEAKRAAMESGPVSKTGKKVKVKYKINEDDTEELEGEIQEGDRYEIVNKQGVKQLLSVVQIKTNGEVVTLARRLDNGVETNVTFQPAQFLSLRDREKWKKLESVRSVSPAAPASTGATSQGMEQGEESNIKEDSIDPTLEPDDVGLAHQGLRPKWEEVKFNKTFGKHFKTDADEKAGVANREDGNDRFYRFTSKYSMLRNNYALMAVTADNDTFGIRREDANPDDIKLIIVKTNSDGSVNYVDVNNEIIPDKKANKNNILYTSMADIKNWTVDRVRDMYTVDAKTTDEDIQEEIDAHQELQNALREQVAEDPDTPLLLDVDRVSPGIRNAERQLDGTFATNPVEGRIIVDDPDWSDLRSIANPDLNIGLRVSTEKQTIKGIKPGRAIMQEYELITSADGSVRKAYTDKVTQVFTRKMTTAEQEKYFKAVKRMVELMNKKYGVKKYHSNYYGKKKKGKGKNRYQKGKKWNKKGEGTIVSKPQSLTTKEKEEYELLLNWLKGVSLWSKPAANESKVRHIWIENGLHFGDDVIKPPLTNKALEENKKIILKEPYFNINRTLLQANGRFKDIKFDRSGKVEEDTEYETYEQFLLMARENGEAPPVYTSFARYDSSTPQRKSAFIVWRNPFEEKEGKEKKSVAAAEGPKVSFSRLDKQITDFFEMKLSKVSIAPNKKAKNKQQLVLQRERRADGGITVYIQSGTGKDKTTQTIRYKSEEEFIDDKDRIINNIGSITGYYPGSTTKYTSTSDIVSKKIEDSDFTEEEIEDLFERYYTGEHIGAFTDEERAILADPTFLSRFRQGQDKEELVVYPALDSVFEHEDGDQFQVTNDPGGVDGTEDVEWINLKTGEEGSWTREEFDEMINNQELSEITDTQDNTDTDDDEEDNNDIRSLDEDEDEDDDDDAPFDTSSKPVTGKSYNNIEDAVKNAQVSGGAAVAIFNNERFEVPATALTGKVQAELRMKIIRNAKSDVEFPSDYDGFRIAIADRVKKTEDFKQLEEFMNRNLPQFAVNRVKRLIGGKAWGAFMNGAIYIYEKAEYGTGFHEAFEAVWATYLSKEEQSQMMEEFRQREGTFTNPYSKQTKQHSEASDWDVKEMLADEFKDYVINNGKLSTKVKQKTKTVFKQLWDFITKIFGLAPSVREELDSKINSVFKKINEGGYRQEEAQQPTRPIEPIVEKNIVGVQESRVKGLSQKEASDIVEGLSTYFFLELYVMGGNMDTLLNNLNDKESNLLFISLYEKAYKNVERELRQLSPEKADLFALHGRSSGEIYTRFKKRLEKYGVKFSEVNDEFQDENTRAERNPLGIVDSISINPRKMTEVNVQMLISSLPETEARKNRKGKWEYEPVKNSMNLRKLADADKVHNLLKNELSNIIQSYDESGKQIGALTKMMQKLDSKYFNKQTGVYKRGYEWIRNLKVRLKYADKSGNLMDTSSLTEDDIKLRVGFIKSFTNVQYVPSKLIVGENGNVYNINPIMSTNENRIREQWANNLKADIQSKKDTIFNIDEKGMMVINKASSRLADLTQRRSSEGTTLRFALDVLDAIGVRFSATEEELLQPAPGYSASRADEIMQNARQILDVIEEGNIEDINNIYSRGKEGQVTGRINMLASIEASYNSEDNILSFLNGEGETQYAVGISSLYGNMINTLNTVKSLKELVISCPWLGRIVLDEAGNEVVELHPYQGSSELLRPGGTLFNEKGMRNNQMLRYQILVGTGMSEVDGVNTAKLEYPERIALKISYLLNRNGAIGFTVINSDKSNEFGMGLPMKNTVTIDMERAKDFVKFMNQPPKASRKADEARAFKEKNTEAVVRKYRDHLMDEMMAAKAYIEDENSPQISHYRKEVINLGHFKDILPAELLTKFQNDILRLPELKEGMDVELGDVVGFILENQEKINDAILNHLVAQTQLTKELLIDNDLFYRNPEIDKEDGYLTDAIDNERLRELFGIKGIQQQVEIKENADKSWADTKTRAFFTEEQIDAIAAYLTINEELITTEQHKMVYGHPAMYSDIPKRASGSTATKQPIVEDNDILEWMDENMERMDGKIRSLQQQQTFKNISFKDVEVVSRYSKQLFEAQYKEMIDNGAAKDKVEKLIGARFNDDGKVNSFILDKKGKYTGQVKVYMGLNEADAMAFILPDFTRDILFLTGKWDGKFAKLWNYHMAYERLVRGGVIPGANGKTIGKNDPRYLPSGSKQQVEADLKAIKKVPEAVFPVFKPQYFGYAKSSGIMHPAFLKHSIQPKFYRDVEGTQFEMMYIAGQNQQVDVIGFESGQKVGNVTTEDGEFVPLYDDMGRVNVQTRKVDRRVGKRSVSINSFDLPEDLPQQELYTRFYGFQVEQAAKTKKATVRGSQVTKEVMTNFYENGEPIPDETGKPSEEIRETITEYNETLIKMVRLGKENLIKELGLTRTKKGDYQVKDVTKLVSLLRRAAEERELPDNVLDAIAVLENGQLMYEFDTLINRDKIDNILNSIVDSRVISEKVHGKSSVQVASTMYEFENRKFVRVGKDGTYEEVADPSVLSDEEREELRMTSSDLQFYRNENGEIKDMEVYIAWPFDEVTPEELGLKLINGIYKVEGNKKIPTKLLEIMGFRIPTQGPNAIEAMTIKGFTPASNGDMIVVPSEIVGKAGSDFDIDKLYIYLPNYDVFLGDKAFASTQFKDYIEQDLMRQGMNKNDVSKILKSLKKQDYEAINYAAFTEEAAYRFGAVYSLEGLPSMDGLTLQDKTLIKNAIIGFKKVYKGKKELVYFQPDDTTSKGLQNKFIELNRKLILHPANFAQLTVPNSTATLKALAEDVRGRKEVADKTKIKPNEKSASFLRSFVGSLSTRERYLLAKRMVGVSALHTTFHTLAQVAGLRISNTKDYTPYYLKTDKESVGLLEIKLDHQKQNPDGSYNIGHRFDTNNIRISDSFSESTSGFVDGAKDPFVFDLNFSLSTAGTWFYLKHLGAPEEQIGYFMNQPILDNYFKALGKNKSLFKRVNSESLTKEDVFFEIVAPYMEKIRGYSITALVNHPNSKIRNGHRQRVAREIDAIYKGYKKFDTASLQRGIAYGNLKNSKDKSFDPEMQLAVLASYLRYEAQAQKIGDFLQAITYDTNSTKTIQENRFKESKWTRIEASSIIANPEAVMNSTFLGELKHQVEDIPHLFRNFFLTLDPQVQEVFEPLYEQLDDPDYFMTKDDAVYMLNRYQNHVLNYILHTTKFIDEDRKEKSLNSLYKNLFLGDKSMAMRLNELKEQEDDVVVSENLFLKELLPAMPTNTTNASTIKLFRNRLDSYDINNVIESLDNLRDYAKSVGDRKLMNFISDITKFAIIQSGVGTSSTDFKKVLSVDTYTNLVKTIFDTFKGSDIQLNTGQVWRSFHQNNFTNRMVVDKAPKFARYEDKTLRVNPESFAARKQFYVKYIPTVTPQKYKEMVRAKQNTRNVFKPVLFERSNITDANGDLIYYPIDAMGEGRNAVEIYTDPGQESIFEANRVDKVVGAPKSDEQGWSLLIAEDVPVDLGVEKTEAVYLGGKPHPGKKSEEGRGKPEGDAKDKAMRKAADSVVVELSDTNIYQQGSWEYTIAPKELGQTSSETSLIEIARRNESTITKDKHTHISVSEEPKVVMLARNNSRKTAALSTYTKQAIKGLHQRGATFIVGDMPGVDEPFVKYLQEIGATYDIYFGNENRLQKLVDRYQEAAEKKADKDRKSAKYSFDEYVAAQGKKVAPDTAEKVTIENFEYKGYKLLLAESNKRNNEDDKPMSKKLFDKMTPRVKQQLYKQLKEC